MNGVIFENPLFLVNGSRGWSWEEEQHVQLYFILLGRQWKLYRLLVSDLTPSPQTGPNGGLP